MSKNRFIRYYYSKLKIPNSRFTNNQSSICSDESENDCRSDDSPTSPKTTVGVLRTERTKYADSSESSSDNLQSLMGNGFSLIELLVVMTIIAVLSSLLLPALVNAREMARRTVCLSNLRQMHLAAEIYANNYDGYYPPAYWFDPPPSSFHERPRFCTTYAWDFIAIKDTVTGERQVIPGILWQGAGDMKIQQCPSFAGAANWFNDPYTGYNYNTSYIGHGYLESIPEPARITDVKSPSTCALFGDGEYGSGANKFMRAPWPNPGDANFSNAGRYAGTQGYRHMGHTNVVYCDGHAESVRECYAETSKKEKVAPGTGFLSPDNSAYDLE